MRRLIFIFLLILLLVVSVFSQGKPRTAVIPFNAIGVAEIESLTASNLFETALVQTDSFLIIEQTQIAEILEAQSFTLSGCTDESCAVEIGKLLSAEQIVLGSFSKVGSGYIINAKIIDVTLGRNIRADKVSFSSMDELSESVDLLAYKLVGLTFKQGGEDIISTVFGELFVSTDPSGADIFINGVKKGQSPDVISKIPMGNVLIVVRQGNLYGSAEVKIETDMQEITIALRKVLGNLFIRSSQQDVYVWLDGQRLGPLDNGLFKDLPVGLHKLELKGNGQYWVEEIELIEGGTTKIEGYPRAVGRFDYKFPVGSSAQIKGRNDFSTSVSSIGIIRNMAAGAYTVTITGSNYIIYEDSITIKQGATLSYTPKLEYTEEYEKLLFTKQLSELEERYEMISFSDISSFITQVDGIFEEIQASSYSFPSLETETKELFFKTGKKQEEFSRLARIKKLTGDLEILNLTYEKEKAMTSKRDLLKYVFGSLSIISLGTSGISWYLGNEAYTNYSNASTTTLTIEYRDQSQMYDIVKLSAGSVGIGFTVLSLINWSKEDELPELRQKIAAISTQIANLEMK